MTNRFKSLDTPLHCNNVSCGINGSYNYFSLNLEDLDKHLSALLERRDEVAT